MILSNTKMGNENENRSWTDDHLFGHEDRSTGQAIARDAYHAAGHAARGAFRAVTGDFKGAGNDFKRAGSHATGENTREAHRKNSGSSGSSDS